MTLEIKFKKIHPDAQLPMRKHGNRVLNQYELNTLDTENEKFLQERPEQYAAGYRVGYPIEIVDGAPSGNIIGTGDTGYDLFSVVDIDIPAKGSAIVDTGIEVAYISPGYWFAIAPRSGLGFKHGIQPHPGIIDNGYQGNLGVKLYNFSDADYNIKKGDRIAQLVFYPVIEPQISWSDESFKTERGSSGFGSSGK